MWTIFIFYIIVPYLIEKKKARGGDKEKAAVKQSEEIIS